MCVKRDRLVVLVVLVGLVVAGACRSQPEGQSEAPAAQSPDAKRSKREAAAPRPSEPRGGASRRLVWVSVETGNAVVEVDLDRRRVLQRHFVAGGPHNITVAPDGTVAVALPRAAAIGLIRNGRLRTVRLGGAPHDVKAAGRLLVVANEGAARVDLLSTTGARRGAVALRADPHDLAVSPDGRSVWASLNDATSSP